MGSDENSTLTLIHNVAKAEFMAKGFREASLRSIVRTAGVTTGAFYGYYNSKEELFAALVDEAYHAILDRYHRALYEFEELPAEVQPEKMGTSSQEAMQEMLLYMFEHREAFLLLLQCSEGTRYANMVDEMVEAEVEATHHYYQVLKKLGHEEPDVDERLEHILVTGMMNAYFEMILHDMPLDKARQYLAELIDFYTAGWMKLMGT